MNAGLNTLERDDLLRKIAWQNARIDKIERMLKGEQVGTARIADAAITNAKIANLTWDKAQGGTATLGGAANGDGILTVKDESDNSIVIVDKDGILVEGGKIIVKNGEDNSIIDENGIVSTNVFPISSISGSPYTDITGTSYVTIGAGINIVLTRSVKALIILSSINASGQINNTLDCSGRTELLIDSDVDGSLLGAFYDSFITVATGVRENIISKTYSYSNIVTLGIGDHTINFKVKLSGNTNLSTTINSYSLSIVLLGS